MLRAVLTIFIIGFGIMSLISMLTAVEGMKEALFQNFASVGSNTFSVSNVSQVANRRRGLKPVGARPIRYPEAISFKKRFEYQALTSVSFPAAFDAVAQFESVKTSPKTQIF